MGYPGNPLEEPWGTCLAGARCLGATLWPIAVCAAGLTGRIPLRRGVCLVCSVSEQATTYTYTFYVYFYFYCYCY